MPLPADAVGASLIGVRSTIEEACEMISARSPAERGRMRHDRNMMPTATRPMRNSGCREFLRVIRLRSASTEASAPSPMIHNAAMSGTPRSDCPDTITQGRNALTASTTPATSGTKYARIPGRKISTLKAQLSTLSVFPFFVPRHLDRLELRLVRAFRVVVEAVEGEDLLAHVGEADGERIEIGKLLRERDRDVLRIGPLHRATSSFFRSDLPSWMPPPSCT